jgi:hypothetical protein
MICTTTNRIRDNQPCADGWKKLLVGLEKTEADDDPLPLVRILDINGIQDAIWSIRTTDCDREAMLFSVACAREVQHLMTDPSSIAALGVTERFANGQATLDEMAAARDAARDAGAALRADAWAAVDAARAAAWAASAAASAACTSASADAWAAVDAARADAEAAAWAAARAAANAARADAEAAARDAGAVIEKQKAIFREIFGS